MKSAKELSRIVLRNDRALTTDEQSEISESLDRLARIESATTEDVKAITESVAGYKKDRCILDEPKAIQEMETLLAVVAKQGAEIEKLEVSVRNLSAALTKALEQRDEARSVLAEYERPMEDAELASISESWTGSSLFDGEFDGDDVLDAVKRAERNIPVLLSALRRERAEKTALSGLVLAYRAADCPFGRPAQIERLEREHGHLAKGPGK